MKKITFFIISVLACSITSAQQFAPAPVKGGSKTMTAAEANKLNGTAQPTINGVPYSQYKAQQEAVKASQPTRPLVQVPVVTTAKDAATAPVTTTTAVVTAPTAAERQPVSVQTLPTVEKATTQTTEPIKTPATLESAKPVQTEKPKSNN